MDLHENMHNERTFNLGVTDDIAISKEGCRRLDILGVSSTPE